MLAQDRLGGGESFGLLFSATWAGAALGPLLLLRRMRDPRRPLYVFEPYAVRGLVDLLPAVVTSIPLAAGALLFYGLSTSTGNVTFSSLIQSRVPEGLRGSAFAFFDLSLSGCAGTGGDCTLRGDPSLLRRVIRSPQLPRRPTWAGGGKPSSGATVAP